MDSLLASYASSDDDEDNNNNNQPQKPPTKQPQSSNPKPSFFTSLPPPKSNPNPNPNPNSNKSSLFSKLPQPKSEPSDPFSLNPSKPKKVVLFRPPIIKNPILDDDDEDDEDDKKQEQKVKDSYVPQAPSVKSFLSSIPAPRNSGSLGAGLSGSGTGTGRRSILEGEVPGLSNLDKSKEKVSGSELRYDDREIANENVTLSADYANYDYSSYAGYENASVDNGVYANVDNAGYVNYDHSSYGPVAPGNDAGYGSYSSYGPAPPSSEYGGYGQYESKWVDRSGGGESSVGPDVSAVDVVQSVARVPGKRGRNEIPTAVIEVSQDELMKNRPREDQVKATGIAFGPAYQPTSSTKGKPTKLHKRKHQIGSLYFDMRSKEMELAERRSKGFLTKAETHAKYGW